MGNIQITITNLLSDLLVNLSAGFLGAAIIIPVQASRTNSFRTIVFVANIGLSCILFVCAVILNT